MLRVSGLLLLAILAFGLLFSLLPARPRAGASGVTLSSARLSLYPEQDPGAVWRFQAREVRVNPLLSENTLDGLGRGERWVRGQDGKSRLDLTLSAPSLTIDGDDNLRAGEATLYIIQDCSTLTLRGSGEAGVLINQRGGFSAPYLRVASPDLNAEYDDVTASFDFSQFSGSQRPGATLDASAPTRCVNGKLVARPNPWKS
ncbi:MAG: hypothetical protein ACR2J4_04680 [Deinococcus sp.]